MKKCSPVFCLLLCLLACSASAATAEKSLLESMNGSWQVDDATLPDPLFMIIDIDNKTVTVSNTKATKSDKFTLGFEEGNSIVLIAREHREAMYFEFKDNDTIITKTDDGKPPRTLKRVRKGSASQ